MKKRSKRTLKINVVREQPRPEADPWADLLEIPCISCNRIRTCLEGGEIADCPALTSYLSDD